MDRKKTRGLFVWRSRQCWMLLGWTATIWLGGFAAARADEGLIQRSGKHIQLTTDVPDGPQLDRWIESFDAAVSLWAKFWNVPSGELDDWTVQAFVMQDDRVFKRLDLIDPRVPDFPFAYALADQVWIRVQESDYYTRHLLLHEGVHSMAFRLFEDTGPTWYREGIAEMLATRSSDDGSVGINQIPTSRQQTPYWGRFKRMNQIRADGKVPRIETVLSYEASLRGDVDVYGWSWALVSMLHAYPDYRPVLLEAAQHGRDTDRQFNRWLLERLSGDWPIIQARWLNLVADFDYGFDWERERIDLSKKDPMWNGSPINMQVAADRGWQSIGVRLSRGMVLKISASGEVILDDDPKPWISTPRGVTVEYHQGQPLGRLIARIVPNVAPTTGTLPTPETIAIAEQATIKIEFPCWLLLRVNDDVGSLSNNQSAYQIQIRSSTDKPNR